MKKYYKRYIEKIIERKLKTSGEVLGNQARILGY